jgi:hypothetical protein
LPEIPTTVSVNRNYKIFKENVNKKPIVRHGNCGTVVGHFQHILFSMAHIGTFLYIKKYDENSLSETVKFSILHIVQYRYVAETQKITLFFTWTVWVVNFCVLESKN